MAASAAPRGAPVPGWPTSIRMIPGAPGGRRAARALAAEITSITRNGGASAPRPILNAMLNVAFKCLDIDRLSPFRALKMSGEDERRPMPVITHDLLLAVKQKLMTRFKPYKFIGLIQLNTGLRLSEPVYARVEDCVVDHPIPHIWIRKNALSNRKN
jgi:integrase